MNSSMAVNLLNNLVTRITILSHHHRREKVRGDGNSSQKVWKGMTNSLQGGSKMKLCKIHGVIRAMTVDGLVDGVAVVAVVIGEIGVSKSVNDQGGLSLFV